MQEPSPVVVSGFARQIRDLCPDFRIVWGEKNYGICRWVIERKLPPEIHRRALDDFSAMFPGEDRFIDQQMTDDDGANVGKRRIDLVPEWCYVHAVEDNRFDLDDPAGYRLPDSRDIKVLWNYLHEFKNMAEQMRAVREEQRLVDEAHQRERVECLARDIKNSNAIWDNPEPIYVNSKNALIGTEI